MTSPNASRTGGPKESASAVISDDGLYRYSLLRWWSNEDERRVMFVMLNPSIADAFKDDPTIKQCVYFGKAWGYGGIIVVNLYAYRSTDPKQLRKAQQQGVDVVGPENDGWIKAHAATNGSLIVAAWGNNAEPQRAWRVQQALRSYDIHTLGLTKTHQPRHPLYVKRDTSPQLWKAAA